MSRCWEVAPGLWVALDASGRGVPTAPGGRRARDRTAADRAERAACRASQFAVDGRVSSRAHTEGVGVSIVGPRGTRVGVDVLRLARVHARHARAILRPSEWRTLEAHKRIRPALAWALKEAAAKATGEPERCFPDGLRIVRLGQVVKSRSRAAPPQLFVTGWLEWESLLVAWVYGARPRDRDFQGETG
jgi:phosphopantetheinyl transferase (holo-ACP synthase)